MVPVHDSVGSFGAYLEIFSASDALVLIEHQYRPMGERFGIVAP